MSFQIHEDQTAAQDNAANNHSLEALVAGLVGHLPLDSTRERVNRAMLQEALLRTQGNYSRAAQLLGVKRQAVQQMVSRMELQNWVDAVKRSRAR
jgi:DNA-binding NtrC family response regulator